VKGPESRGPAPWTVYKGQALEEEGNYTYQISTSELTLTLAVLSVLLDYFLKVYRDLLGYSYNYRKELNYINYDSEMTDPIPTPRGSSLAYPEMVCLPSDWLGVS